MSNLTYLKLTVFTAVIAGLGLTTCTAGERKKMQLGKVTVYTEEKRVEVEGKIEHGPGVMIEVFACTPAGKTHETVLVCDCVPSNVHAALLLIGLKAGKHVRWGKNTMIPPTGDPVKVSVRWTNDEGKKHLVRATDMLYNVKAKRAMKQQFWVFAGSVMDPEADKPYVADIAGNIITTYNDAATVLDNPADAGADDEMVEINGKVCPKPGSKVTLVLEPGPRPQPK